MKNETWNRNPWTGNLPVKMFCSSWKVYIHIFRDDGVLAALVYSKIPDLEVKSVVDIIKQGCDDIGEEGYDIYTGYDRVDFGKTIRVAVEREK